MSGLSFDTTRRPLVLAAFAVGMLACASTPKPAPADPVLTHVRAMMARAKAAEPAVTARLGKVAERFGGHLHKLEHRLKTEKSALRKVRLELASEPGLAPSDVMLGDMLRYTMVLEDQPLGNYVAAVHDCLSTLEADGHSVKKVKNYWPSGDNYSGVNATLQTPDGLPWELQFHTAASIEVQTTTREQYEELRLAKTPKARKRELFDQMSAAWDTVPIPAAVLEQNNLHAVESIKHRPRP